MTRKHSDITPYDQKDVAKKKQVASMFDNIAPYYDFLNRFLSAGIDRSWRKKAIAELKKYNPQLILDIATGTADLAIEAARQIEAKHITGIDISNQMLKIGKEKIKRKNLEHLISLEYGDSENLPYPDNQFDAITVAFGVRNFENLEKGLSEMFRVLKEDGKVVILEFSRPRHFPLKQLFNVYFKNILPVIGKLRSKDPKAYRYLYDSVQAFPDYDQLIAILEKAGFIQAKWKSLTMGICTIYTAKK